MPKSDSEIERIFLKVLRKKSGVEEEGLRRTLLPEGWTREVCAIHL